MLFTIGVVIPVVLVGVSGLVKTMVRKSFEIKDYYLGIDFVLAAMVTAATYGIDLANRSLPGTDEERLDKVLWVLIFGVFAGLLFLILVITHQIWETRIDGLVAPAQLSRRRWEEVSLLLLSDVVGVACLATFLFLVKGLA